MTTTRKRFAAAALAAGLVLSAAGPGHAADPAAIAVDLVIGRPAMLFATIAGSALFVLALPVTAPTGMYDEALERFVTEPGNRLIGPIGE